MSTYKEKRYLNGRLCNGPGRGITEYTKSDLIRIANNNKPRISIPKGSKKEDICRLLIESGVKTDNYVPKVNIYDSIEKLMEYLEIDDAKNLVNMTTEELEDIIAKIKLYDGKTRMIDFLEGKTGSERVKAFLIAMAEKYCRCLKGVDAKGSSISPNAICSSTVFNKKGLKGPGSGYQCLPVPLLLPTKKSRFVLEKKI